MVLLSAGSPDRQALYKHEAEVYKLSNMCAAALCYKVSWLFVQVKWNKKVAPFTVLLMYFVPKVRDALLRPPWGCQQRDRVMRGWGPGEGRCGGEMRVCWKQLSSSASACHTNMPGGWWGQALVMTGSSRVKEGTEVVHGQPLKLSRLEERHFSNCCGKISQKVWTKGEEFFFSLCPFVALLLPMTSSLTQWINVLWWRDGKLWAIDPFCHSHAPNPNSCWSPSSQLHTALTSVARKAVLTTWLPPDMHFWDTQTNNLHWGKTSVSSWFLWRYGIEVTGRAHTLIFPRLQIFFYSL